MDKHFKPTFSCLFTQLGVLVNTRNLALSMPYNNNQDLVKNMLNTWNSSRKRLTLHEVASLLGLLSILTLTTHWIKCYCITLQHSTSLTLKFKSNAVFASGKCKHLTYLLRSKSISMKNFCSSKYHKTVWNLKDEFHSGRDQRPLHHDNITHGLLMGDPNHTCNTRRL